MLPVPWVVAESRSRRKSRLDSMYTLVGRGFELTEADRGGGFGYPVSSADAAEEYSREGREELGVRDAVGV